MKAGLGAPERGSLGAPSAPAPSPPLTRCESGRAVVHTARSEAPTPAAAVSSSGVTGGVAHGGMVGGGGLNAYLNGALAEQDGRLELGNLSDDDALLLDDAVLLDDADLLLDSDLPPCEEASDRLTAASDIYDE